MPDQLGYAEYQLTADRTQLKQDLDAGAQDIQAGGATAEQQATDAVLRSVDTLGLT